MLQNPIFKGNLKEYTYQNVYFNLLFIILVQHFPDLLEFDFRYWL
jgi:hypothetical protein